MKSTVFIVLIIVTVFLVVGKKLYATKENSKGLIKTDLKNFEFKKGEWLIEKPIVIEGDLHIPAGTKLKFSKNSYLIIKGSLIAIGSEDSPIIFEPIYE